MIEKYLRHKITRTDLETRVLNKSLAAEYAKLGGMTDAAKIESVPKDSVLQAKIVKPKAPVATTPTTEVKKTAVDTTKKN
jgi:penicillin-binding protein 2